MTGDEAAARARALFLDERHPYGCAETTLLVLREAYGLPGTGTGEAMALNGGVAYSGGVCGAISGAAIAVGLLAERRCADHAEAKRLARETIAGIIDDFEAEHGSIDCRTLLGRSIRTPEEHEAFLASDVWRDVCLGQIESVVRRTAELPDDPRWERASHLTPSSSTGA